MKKVLILLLLSIFLGGYIFASDLEFGYNQTKTSHIKYLSFYNKSDGKISLENGLNWMDSLDGYSYKAFFNLERKLNRNLFSLQDPEFFFFGDYETNTMLEIKNRVKLGLGLGFYLKKGIFYSHKLSAALVLAENKVMESFRYKYRFNTRILETKLVLNYITPINEFESNIKVGFRILKSLQVGIKASYRVKDQLDNYFANIFFKYSL